MAKIKMRKSGRPRKNIPDDERDSDSGSDCHHSDSTGDDTSSTLYLEHNLNETQRSLTQSTSSLLAQCALRNSPRLNKYPILDMKDIASPSSTLTPPLTIGLLETTSASQTSDLVVAQESQEHNLNETQRSLTQSTSSLLAQCALRNSPSLNKYPILDMKDIASPSSTLTPPLTIGLLETTSASQTFDLVVAQESQEIAVPFRESTTSKKRGRPRKVKEILVEEFGHSSLNTTASDKEPARCVTPEESRVLFMNIEQSSHLNTTASDTSFDQKKRRRVTFSPEEPQIIILEHGPEFAEPQIITLEHKPEFAVSNPPVPLSSPMQKDQCLDQPLGLDHTDILARLYDSPDPDEVDLVKVDEYIVKKEIAPLLTSILAKQGNIAKHCIVESKTIRSFFLENVCGLYQKLEKKDPKRIKVSEVKSMLYEVGSFEQAGLEVKWLKERLDGIAKTLEESKDYLLMKMELDWNNEDSKSKKKQVEELEAMTSVARNELATIDAKGMELCERISNTKAKWECFCEQNLVKGLI